MNGCVCVRVCVSVCVRGCVSVAACVSVHPNACVCECVHLRVTQVESFTQVQIFFPSRLTCRFKSFAAKAKTKISVASFLVSFLLASSLAPTPPDASVATEDVFLAI